jgi:hypothetical protein
MKTGQDLEDAAGDPKLALGWLVWIGGGADDEGEPGKARGIQGLGHDPGSGLLDEDAGFKQGAGGEGGAMTVRRRRGWRPTP